MPSLKYPYRKAVRLSEHDYSTCGYYFITMCAHQRELLFGQIRNDEMHENVMALAVRDIAEILPDRFNGVEIDHLVIMPNHVHAIVWIDGAGAVKTPSVGEVHARSPKGKPPQRRNMTLSLVVGYWKMNAAKRINFLRGTSERPVWQRSFYDHVIRNDADLFRVREYIVNNPLQWALDEENPEYI